MKTDPVPHVHTTTRTFSALRLSLSANIRRYLDYVQKAPLWQFPIHVIPLIVLYLVSFVINKFNKETK